MVINGKAHPIHDENMQWFKSIEDINNHFKLKQSREISLQVDNAATLNRNDSFIFMKFVRLSAGGSHEHGTCCAYRVD